jgi:hypothetical protein
MFALLPITPVRDIPATIGIGGLPLGKPFDVLSFALIPPIVRRYVSKEEALLRY